MASFIKHKHFIYFLAILFCLGFFLAVPEAKAAGSIEVKAGLTSPSNPWSGSVNYTLIGPGNPTGTFVPNSSFSCLAGQNFTLQYNSGGPGGAPTAILPSASLTCIDGTTVTFTMYFSGKPDLVPQNLHIAFSANAGEPQIGSPITFAADIYNPGTAPVPLFYTRLRVDLGNDGSWDLTPPGQPDYPIPNGVCAINPWPTTPPFVACGLAWGGTSPGGWTANVPGTHRYEICVDATGAIDELDETNNCKTDTFRVILPDYYIESVYSLPPSPIAGNSMTFSGLARNLGPGFNDQYHGSISYSLKIDIGNDGSWDVFPADYGSVNDIPNVNPFPGYSVAWSGVWTAVAGTHKYEICADSTSLILEGNESNNCTSGVFTVTGPPTAPLNLQASSVCPAAGNADMNLTWTDATDETGYNVYRSTTSGFTPNDGTNKINGSPLAANTTAYTDTTPNLSTTYYYKVRAFNAVGNTDSSEATASTADCRPDLVVLTPLTINGSLTVGQSLTFSGTVKNQGSFNAGASTARFCINSTDANNCLTNVVSGIWRNTPATAALSANSSAFLTSSASWTAVAGSYTLYLCADVNGNGVVTESSEGAASNCSSLPFVINSPPVANAKISLGDCTTRTDSVTVTQGTAVNVWLCADDSSDPNGWADATNGVSTDPGKCEWNKDLDQTGPPPSFEYPVAHPVNQAACDINLGSLTFNDPPGTITYQVLKITDKQGAVSNIDTVSVVVNLAAPTNLTATAFSCSQINLGWTDKSTGEEGFTIERSPNGTTGWVQITQTGPNATTYSNSSLTGSTQYYYRVRAFKAGVADSANSNVANATTPSCAVPDFTISASPNIRAPQTGTSQSTTITITPQNGFNSDVTLSLVSPPATISLNNFSPAVIVGGSGTSAMTINTNGTPTGTYTLTVHGDGGGKTHDATLTLTVVNLDGTLSANPSSRGVSFVSTLTANKTGNEISPYGFTYDCGNGASQIVHTNISSTQDTANCSYNLAQDYTASVTISGSVASPVTKTTTVHGLGLNIQLDQTKVRTLKGQTTPPATVTVSSVNNYSGNIDLTISAGMPSRTTEHFSPQTLSIPAGGSAQSTLTIDAAGNASNGTSHLTIHGQDSANGVPAADAPLDLMIGAKPSWKEITPW